jgi:hypothetical protein
MQLYNLFLLPVLVVEESTVICSVIELQLHHFGFLLARQRDQLADVLNDVHLAQSRTLCKNTLTVLCHLTCSFVCSWTLPGSSCYRSLLGFSA